MEDFDEIDFKALETAEDVETMLKEKMGMAFVTMQDALNVVLKSKAEELTHDFTNIAPNGDYEKLLEDNDSMAAFLKETAAALAENWKITEIRVDRSKIPLLQCQFINTTVDDGTTLEGHVFLGRNGTIRHAFVQGNGKG